VSEGIEHERARKMLNPAFHAINLQSMVSIMVDQTRKVIDELFASTNSPSVNLQTELNALTLSIIASCAFGKGFETIGNAKDIVNRAFTVVLQAVEYRTMRMVNQIPVLALLPFWHKHIVDEGTRETTQFVEQIIVDRRQNRSKSLCSGSDILDLLLSAVDAEGQPFTDQEIKDEALTFVFAGHETTGNLIVWTLYVLMTNEQVLRACRDEVDRVLSDNIDLTYENMSDLVVCEAVLQETLRLYPPAPIFARHCIREHTIGSKDNHRLHIPLNAVIVTNTYLLHRRAEFWARPLEFDYTRWMRDPITGLKPKLAHPFCYLPFAAGPRNCIGQNFALLEAKVMLAMLVKRCTFELVPGQKVTPDVRITMRPKYGLWAKITKR
jgi:cytochrome P450